MVYTVTTQSHSSLPLGSGQIHLDWTESLLCYHFKVFLTSLSLALLQLLCYNSQALGFPAASTSPQIGCDLPTQVSRCTNVMRLPQIPYLVLLCNLLTFKSTSKMPSIVSFYNFKVNNWPCYCELFIDLHTPFWVSTSWLSLFYWYLPCILIRGYSL